MAENDVHVDDIETVNGNYDANQIQVLEGLEAVRKRPGMYIGSTCTKGLHHLVYEVVDNSIDEAMAGHGTYVRVTIHSDGSLSVSDNGRGIPVDTHATGKSALEVVLTVLHAGGKFGGGGYKVSGGLHGVGVSVVNALSEWMEVQVRRNGHLHSIKLEKGNTVEPTKVIGDVPESDTGTTVRFKPDTTIFETVVFDFEVLKHRLRELAFLNRNVKIELIDERTDKKQTFHYEGGISSFVEHVNKNKNVLYEKPVYMIGEKNGSIVEVALQHNDGYNENLYSFVNNIHTTDGGTHVTGFRSALTKVVNDFARKFNVLKESDPNLTSEDMKEGLTVVVSVKIPEPQFEGQTKTKLGTSEARGLVDGIVNEHLSRFFEENQKTSRLIIEKSVLAFKAREASRKAKEITRRKNALDSNSLPGKLADCSSKVADECEIYLVEGDSAGGSAKQGRDRRFQAILPLRGKILNVEKSRLDKILGNEEIRAMITAFGSGVGDDFNIDKRRYGKIIIMTDADVDGAHIRTLLLTFFYRYMPKLIENGHVYLAQPPLYQVKKGKMVPRYCYSDVELSKVLAEIGREDVTVQRYKGLGEMNPEQLWDTTMNPRTRTVIRMNIEDAIDADEIFTVLMGEKVEPRRKFIEENSHLVANLDV